ncbi:MAG TPA: hypothetical protein DCM08_08265 [Microscillaceae bacterium]|nr:hypothetical protein [Microscillaceae bacterium]
MNSPIKKQPPYAALFLVVCCILAIWACSADQVEKQPWAEVDNPEWLAVQGIFEVFTDETGQQSQQVSVTLRYKGSAYVAIQKGKISLAQKPLKVAFYPKTQRPYYYLADSTLRLLPGQTYDLSIVLSNGKELTQKITLPQTAKLTLPDKHKPNESLEIYWHPDDRKVQLFAERFFKYHTNLQSVGNEEITLKDTNVFTFQPDFFATDTLQVAQVVFRWQAEQFSKVHKDLNIGSFLRAALLYEKKVAITK